MTSTTKETESSPQPAGLMTLVDAAISSSESVDSSRHSVASSISSAPTLGFIETLRQTLDDDSYSEIIAWMPDRNSFTIVNHKVFVKEVMPKVFSMKNMSSFVRKLSRFGFARKFDKKTMNTDIFHNKDFSQDKPELDASIKCAPIAKPASKAVTLSAVSRAKAATAVAAPLAGAALANSRRPSASETQ